MNNKNLQKNNMKQSQPQDQARKKAPKSNWGDEMIKAANKSLRKGLPVS